MNKTIFMFRTVTLRPHWFQYIINETGSLCLLVASIWIYKFCSFAYHEWAIYACILLLFHVISGVGEHPMKDNGLFSCDDIFHSCKIN